MDIVLFSFLYFLAFAAGIVFSYLVLVGHKTQPEEEREVQAEILPDMDEKLKKQYDNLFRYNGSERGQMSIE